MPATDSRNGVAARSIAIGGTIIDDQSDCYVIAELGQNHQGSLEIAIRLMEAAAASGANAVKLQKRDNRRAYTRAFSQQPYTSKHSFGPTYGAHREYLELDGRDFMALQSHARQLGITMFATPFDIPSADFLADLDVPAFKIASGDLTNTPLLRRVSAFGRPVVLSTGGAAWADVERAYAEVSRSNTQVCILQCTAIYPPQPVEMDLRVITSLRARFAHAVVGLSDHSAIPVVPCVAYTLGARMVECHLTLDRSWRGSDHPISLEPPGLARMIEDLRLCRQLLGQPDKRAHERELAHLRKTSKKLIVARDLPAGHALGWEDVAVRAPGDGMPPYEVDRVVGRVIRRPMRQDEDLTWEVLS